MLLLPQMYYSAQGPSQNWLLASGGKVEEGGREEAAQTWAGRAVEGVRLQLTPGGGVGAWGVAK